MRVIFMGTPEFAVPSLRLLIERAAPGDLAQDRIEIVGVVTRVDKPSGRGRQVVPSPVKQLALEAGLPVFQPGPLRRAESLELLTALAPDLIVVAAFGQILPPDIIHLPPRGCLNVHASLLPRHRGASPIAAAILAGDAETGVTIMRMDEGLDTGPILTTRATPIGPDETTGELTARLAEIGADLLAATLPRWLAGEITPDATGRLARHADPPRAQGGRPARLDTASRPACPAGPRLQSLARRVHLLEWPATQDPARADG